MAIPLPGTVIDLGKLFQNTFGGRPYVIGEKSEDQQYVITGKNSEELTSPMGSLIKEKVNGVDVWLPVRFYDVTDNSGIPIGYVPYSVVKVSGKKTIVKTPLMHRLGTVKRQYNIDDYQISVRGFLVGINGRFPEEEMDSLKDLYENRKPIRIDNAITNVFLKKQGIAEKDMCRVVIESLEFPEIEGGRINIKPFAMQLLSDFVFTLELK